MKLKKIASLMLAGVMAVSMLAGCSGNTANENPGSEPETPASSSVTESVLNKTSEAIRNQMTVNTDTKLDDAVAYAARNNSYGMYQVNPAYLDANGKFVKDAEKYMTGGDIQDYSDAAEVKTWDFSYGGNHITKDATYWTMAAVTSTRSDEWIENYIANALDEIADDLDNESVNYSLRVAMADCKADKDTEDVGDTVIIGVAITCDVLKDNH